MIGSAAKKVVFAAAVLLGGGFGMYETERGKNDWSIQTLGEVSDLVLFTDRQAYSLSTDGLLTFFDTTSQQMSWRKQLPQAHREKYTLRHLGRNLIALSDNRVAMFNSQGHIIFEQPLEGDGPSVAEIFKADESIFSCFVRGDDVVVYKHY